LDCLRRLQGYGIASGLLAAGAFAPDTPAAISIIVSTIVGATAVLLWLSDQIKLRGLRHGLWLLWSATFFFSLPAELAIAAEETKVGAMSLVHWLVNVAYVFCALAAVVAVNHSWIKRIEGLAPQPSPHSVDTLSIFVWPIFLASMVGGYVLTIVIVLIQEAWQPSQLMLKAVATLIIVFLIPVFVLGYAKLHLKAIPPSPGTASSVYRGAAIVAGLEVALFLTGSFVGYFFDLPLTPNGILFIVVGTIFTAVARNHRTLHRGAVVGFAEP